MTKHLCFVVGRLDGVLTSLVVDDGSGLVQRVGRTATGPRPMPVVVDAARRLLHVGNGGDPHSIAALSWAPDGSTRLIATVECPIAQTYMSVVGDLLMAVSYAQCRLACARIGSDGLVDASSWRVSGTGRQPHCIVADPDGRHVYMSLLGEDSVVGFRVADGELVPDGSLAAGFGREAGPRHIRFSPDGSSLYVIEELGGRVVHFRRDPVSGALAPSGSTMSCVAPDAGLRHGVYVPPGREPTADETDHRIWASDLVIGPDGTWAVASERRASTLTMTALDPDGGFGVRFAQLGTQPQPRGMGLIGPHLVIVGSELGRTASIYRADARGLREAAVVDDLGGPIWMESVPLPSGDGGRSGGSRMPHG
ncbi:beta-propeller fold lactonase family protein [uncultured Propionibacterium sp.]|uniref:lactonase family protein n=1 Tax=uncultured Propionibacterium sp. TaxID=218066 RepID=UPI00292D0D45|nr:beta-propeller fold lactonase family protein [uncultured Propionibacterium sp.]